MAANDRISIQRDQAAAVEAADLLALVRDLRSVYERATRIRAKMRHCFDDAGGTSAINWAAVQTLWGVPAGGTNVGPTAAGAVVFTLIDGAAGSMDGSFQTSAARDITERVG